MYPASKLAAADPAQSRGKLVESITSPLGFFVLALLIVEAFLATVLVGANLESRDQILGVWLGVGMFVVVVVMVFALVWFKVKNFVFDRQAHLAEQRLERERARRAGGGFQLRELSALLEQAIHREIASEGVAAKVSQAPKAEVLHVLKAEADRISDHIKSASFISVDLTAFGQGLGTLSFPVAALKNASALTDEVYFALEPRVRPYAYGTDWVLRDRESKRVFRTLRMLVGAPVGEPLTDVRSLEEFGITPGMALEAVRPPPGL